MDWILPVLIAAIVFAVVKWVWDRTELYSMWKKLGINGPKPSSLFLGNLLDLSAGGAYAVNKVWTQKYGKVYGYYEGTIPTLCVADPDMLKEILIKQFDKFEQRVIFFDVSDDPFVNMVNATGEKWKRLRTLSSPTFTAKKMKLMSPLVSQSIEKLMKLLSKRAEANENFDISKDMKRLTLDVIASTVFSFDTDVFNDQESIFLKKMKEVFDSLAISNFSLFRKVTLLMFTSFPSLLPIAKMFDPRIITIPNDWFLSLAKKIITQRQSSGELRNDYMQLMLNTDHGDYETDKSSSNESRKKSHSDTSKYMTMEEMQGQTFVFLAAGHETTATALSFISYYLAIYPDIQAKLQQEVDTHYPEPGKNINYETVQNLPYLDMVFCEASRMTSIGQLAFRRMCLETTTVGNVLIPKGTKIIINMPDIHMNQDLWGPEPTDEFVPERFLPERKEARHSMSYLAFGAGPRNCIGMRFAIMEAKMALITILQKYTLLKCDRTQVPLEITQDGVPGPVDGIFVRLKERQQ